MIFFITVWNIKSYAGSKQYWCTLYSNGGKWADGSTERACTFTYGGDDDRGCSFPEAPTIDGGEFVGFLSSSSPRRGSYSTRYLTELPSTDLFDIVYKLKNNISNNYTKTIQPNRYTTVVITVNGTTLTIKYTYDSRTTTNSFTYSNLIDALYPAYYWYDGPGGSSNFFAVYSKASHTHSYTKHVQDVAPTCTAAGSGHYECPTDGARNGATYSIPALGHSYGSWSDWTNISNTQQQRTQACSRCGDVKKETRTRTYNIDLNINNSQGTQARNDGGYGWGYVKVSLDNVNWSDEITNETSLFASRQYGDKIYIKYTRPYYDYLEFGSISVTNNKGLVDLGNNVWCYTVSDNPISGYAGGIIDIYMDYKHTTLTLNPNGGSISGNIEAQVLSPKLQYSTSQWNNLSTKKPSRTGYTFMGWYDQASGGTKAYNVDGTCVRGTKYFDNNGNSLMTSDVTLYAQWSINTYHIYYTLYGSSASVKRTYVITDNAFTLPTPALSGYTFKGWIGGIDKKDPVRDTNGKSYSTPTGNITIPKGTYGDYFFRAVFEKNHSVDADGNNTDDVYVAHSEAKEKQYH